MYSLHQVLPEIHSYSLGTISSDKLEEIEKYLISLPQNLVAEEISEAIQKFQVPIGEFTLASQLDNIAKYFDDPKSLLELVQELESSSGEWEQKIAKKLRSMSPTSLAITFKQIQDGKNMSFYDVFAMEYRLGKNPQIYEVYYFQLTNASAMSSQKEYEPY